MKSPSIFQLENLIKVAEGLRVNSLEGWVPVRSPNYPSFRRRLKAAWLVFTGRADAVIWPAGQ